ncbi:ABC transporter substrate-binding protein [Chloroflexota bacterium]
MFDRLIKVTSVVLAAVMLLTVPSLVGCGERDGVMPPVIVIGCLGDLTGPGAFVGKMIHSGQNDYINMAKDKGLVPGVWLNLSAYDSKGDESRVQSGYKWLKERGADIICTMSGDEAAILESKAAADEIPIFSSQSSMAMSGSEWVYGNQPPPGAEGQMVAHWIEETWNAQGPAKIGLVGHDTLLASQEVRDAIEAWCETSSKLDFLTAQMVPYGTATWDAEIAHLMDCDFIVDTTIGFSLATFERAIRLAGYEGQLIGIMESFLANWNLVIDVVSSVELDGAVATSPYPSWTDPATFIKEIKLWNSHYLIPEEITEVLGSCGRICGWANGMIVVEAIRQAVNKVGAENVDGKAVADGLRAVDLNMEGFGNTLQLEGDLPCFVKTLRMMKWDSQREGWVGLTDWYRPPMLQP